MVSGAVRVRSLRRFVNDRFSVRPDSALGREETTDPSPEIRPPFSPTAAEGDRPELQRANQHETSGFQIGALKSDPGKRLQGDRKQVRHLGLSPGDASDRAPCAALVDEALRLDDIPHCRRGQMTETDPWMSSGAVAAVRAKA